jgi:glycosyltransferase involved in cell wall biosynthesis
MVSIVLPTHNGARYLSEAIEACLGQTWANIELVVVVDGSRDDTESVLAGFDDGRMRVLRHKENRGLPEALNTGFSATKGRYLTWTSDDNLYAPGALATMADYLDAHPHVGFVYADYWLIDPEGRVLGRQAVEPQDVLMERCCVGPCFLYRREVHDDIGGYNTELRLIEDYEYWLRVSQEFVMEPIQEPLYYYRTHPASLTSQTGVIHKRWRMGTVLKRKRFGMTWKEYAQEMSRIDIDEAFACYRKGQYRRVPGLALRGIGRNPSSALNPGLWSILLRSLSQRIAERASAEG